MPETDLGTWYECHMRYESPVAGCAGLECLIDALVTEKVMGLDQFKRSYWPLE